MLVNILLIMLKFAVKALISFVFLAAAVIAFVIAFVLGSPFSLLKKVQGQPVLVKA